MSDVEAGGSVKSADRVLDLFELLGRWGDRMSHTQIADALQIPKSSLTQPLRNLTARGYVEYLAEEKKYRLGDGLLRLARKGSRLRNIVELAPPILQAISEATGESSALNVLAGDQSEVVAAVSSSQRLVSHMRQGDLAPLYATSGGKIFLAHLPREMREEYLAKVKFQRITPNTLASISALRRELDAALKEKVAYSHEEFTLGIVGMAVPVLSAEGEVLAALNVAIPSVRFNARLAARARQALQKGAEALERELGIDGEAIAASTRIRGGA